VVQSFFDNFASMASYSKSLVLSERIGLFFDWFEGLRFFLGKKQFLLMGHSQHLGPIGLQIV